MQEIIQSYSDLDRHREIGDLIRRYSENKEDIRSIVYRAADVESRQSLLDLGCGYGWFEEGLRGPFDVVVGIDCHGENGRGFLSKARPIAKRASFLELLLPQPIPFKPASFDLVVCAYSLYFFPAAVEEAKRLLRDDGLFVAITHAESMMEEGERHFSFTKLRNVIRNFSAENGGALLGAHFRVVESIDYRNALVFPADAGPDLEKYIDFKADFIRRDVDPELVKRTILRELRLKESVRLTKDDRIFLARK